MMKASKLIAFALLSIAPLLATACSPLPEGSAATPAARTGWIDFALVPTPVVDRNSMISNATRADLPL